MGLNDEMDQRLKHNSSILKQSQLKHTHERGDRGEPNTRSVPITKRHVSQGIQDTPSRRIHP